MSRDRQHFFFLFALIVALLLVSLNAQTIAKDDALIKVVSEFSYFGVFITAVIAGLNTFVPLPAATFTPLFLAAGLSMPFIITTLVAGTLLADFVGYTLGHVSRELLQNRHPKLFNFFTQLRNEHTNFIVPTTFIYAALLPLPNEFILVPLALAGTNFRKLLLPLIIGNIVHQTLLAYGITNIFQTVF